MSDLGHDVSDLDKSDRNCVFTWLGKRLLRLNLHFLDPGVESAQIAFSVAILLAALFNGFPPRLFFDANFNSALAQLLTLQPDPNAAIPTSEQVIRIGIVSGHWGHDSGAVCANRTTEQQVNLMIAALVQQKLIDYGHLLDLPEEFDPPLNGYKAVALLSFVWRLYQDRTHNVQDGGCVLIGLARYGQLFGRDHHSLRTQSTAAERYAAFQVIAIAATNWQHLAKTASFLLDVPGFSARIYGQMNWPA